MKSNKQVKVRKSLVFEPHDLILLAYAAQKFDMDKTILLRHALRLYVYADNSFDIREFEQYIEDQITKNKKSPEIAKALQKELQSFTKSITAFLEQEKEG